MKPFRVVLLLAGFVLIPLVVKNLQAQPSATTSPAATPVAATTQVTVNSRTMTLNGQSVGEVLVGNNVVLRIREAAGGYTAGQRAGVVATRLTSYLSQGMSWQSLSVGTFNNQTALLMGNNLLVTADPREAALNGDTPLQLADAWLGNTTDALRGVTASAVAGSTESWPDWTNATTKIVPIISAGTPGLQLGAAQVTGPKERVDTVKAVLELDLVFQKTARIMVFIPSTQIASLKRVQGVAVSALLQYRLFKF